MSSRTILDKSRIDYIRRARFGILGTIDWETGRAHLVPIVFVYHRGKIYFVVDNKKKKKNAGKKKEEAAKGKLLKRIQNLSQDPRATLLINEYSEDWSRLSHLILYCRARILWPHSDRREKARIASHLMKKYIQYRKKKKKEGGGGGYFPSSVNEAIFVSLTPERAIWWQNLRNSLG